MDTVGKRLRFAREKKGLTLRQLAELMGKKNHTTVIAWEKDQAELNISQLKQLAELLETSEDFLMFGRSLNKLSESTPGYSMIESTELARLRALEAEILRKENAELKKRSESLKNNPTFSTKK